MVRRLLIVAVVVAALGGTAVTTQSGQAQTPAKKLDLTGVYLCDGMNPDGRPYRGLVEIAEIEDTYLVRWVLQDDIEVMGVGIVQNGLLAVSYFGGTPAVVVYLLDASRPERLVGEWTMGGTEGRLYKETLTRMPKDSVTTPAPRRRPTPRARPVPGGVSI